LEVLGVSCLITHSVGLRQIWRISCENISAITTSFGLKLGGLVRLPWNQIAKRSWISTTTDGRSLPRAVLATGGFLNYDFAWDKFNQQFAEAIAGTGPHLIDAMVPPINFQS